jgi:hypothetical protein
VDYLIEALVFDTNKYEFRKYGRKIWISAIAKVANEIQMKYYSRLHLA